MTINAFIVDVDGTLVDVAPFLHHLSGPIKDFDAFHRDTNAHGEPNAWVIELCRRRIAAGDELIIVTGRTNRHMLGTAAWLDEHFPLPHVGPICRRDDDRRDDNAVKRDVVDELTRIGYQVTGAVDDRPGVLGLWRDLGLDPVVVHRPAWDAAGEPYSAEDLAAWELQAPLRTDCGWAPTSTADI